MNLLRRITTLVLVLAAMSVSTATFATDDPAETSSRQIGRLAWHTDYAEAYAQAKRDHQQLFIFFRDESQENVADAYERNVLADELLEESLARYTRAIVPLDTPSIGNEDSEDAYQAQPLVEHDAFEHLHQRQGLVIIDFVEPGSPIHGLITAAHPFTPGKHYTFRSTLAVLGLPRGTITQRALVYAVRIHPDAPASTDRAVNHYLFEQAHQHSLTQARYSQVGHQNWSHRFQVISAQLGGRYGVNEIAASGNGETMIEAAQDCVAGWRQSPGHWQHVAGHPQFYGYDLVQSGTGKWYGTGILAYED